MKRLVLLLAVAVMLCAPAMAKADFLVGASSITSADWSAVWQENGVGPFTKMEFSMLTPGIQFASPPALD